ncbi:MAG: hypothetical protein GY862_37865 [Gammaproteobacteria bacterium]|nr:hypothetical protein [Gammaproteobacteria bacterium]
MSNLVELVFENIQFDNGIKLVADLTQSGNTVLNFTVSNDDCSGSDTKSMPSVFSCVRATKNDFSIFINTMDLIWRDFSMPPCSFQFLRYSGQYDINIIFDLDSFHMNFESIKSNISCLAKTISDTYGFDHYYAGLELGCPKLSHMLHFF